tara:strand:+ start:10 stop:414 length:405 start_codon:yes stop_codon:yes gene_type:complete
MNVSQLMKEYFDCGAEESNFIDNVLQINTHHMPVVPFKNTWEVVESPQRLLKDFNFDNFFILKNFLNEILEYQEEIQHHSKITINHLEIRIEVYTHDVETVTEIDLEFAKSADQIYEDVKFYEVNSEQIRNGSY